MKKIITSILSAMSIVVLMPLAAFAHMVVTPAQANVGSSVEFNISVPNERTATVSSLKLSIPAGVTDVQPDVKGGWTIDTTKNGDTVSAITWTGTIPAGQRADFGFKAQVPASAGDIAWKATQTYADGVVVNWDQTPTAHETDTDNATSGPYSITTVSDDLNQSNTTKDASSNQASLAFVFSIVALALSVLTFVWRRRK